jgi:hypothetical protein
MTDEPLHDINEMRAPDRDYFREAAFKALERYRHEHPAERVEPGAVIKLQVPHLRRPKFVRMVFYSLKWIDVTVDPNQRFATLH